MRCHVAAVSCILSVICSISGCTKSTPVTPDSVSEEQESVPSQDSNSTVSAPAENGKVTEPVSSIPVENVIAAPEPAQPAPATEVATAAPVASAPLSRKEMLNLVSSGVVVVTALNAYGEMETFGSGCIVGKGLVLTNYHVVNEAITAKVQPKGDGEERLGNEIPVLGYRAVDDRNDLILLEVEGLPSDLHTFSVPESESLEQHDQVFCMGHPDGLKFSTSPGFVSAMLKTSDMPEQLRAMLQNPNTEWIQTDAVISGGSSGGSLLDEAGRLVGINTLVIPDSRIAFAVSASHIRSLLSSELPSVLPLPLPEADVITTRSLADVKAGFDREFRQLIVDVRRLQATDEGDEIQKLIRRNNPGPACLRQCCELVEAHRGAAEAADALKVCADVIKASPSISDSGRQYLDELLSKATADPNLIPLSPRVINSLWGLQYSRELELFLRRVIHSDQQNSLKAAAGVVLVSAMASFTDQSLKLEMLELAEDIRTRFGTERFFTGTIEEVLTPICDAEKLAVGSVAPEITGTDIQGETFRLSDYRGKVVMLDFWADWCPHCRKMYPEERELVERLKEKPFALLGVNGDEVERASRVIEAGNVTWRSWLDGSGGPIAEQYQIQAWPTILLLDATGRIRFTELRGAELEAAIESLLNDSPGTIPQDVLAENASWRYLPLSGKSLPESWNQPDFDDTQWQSGAGSFSFAGLHESGTDLPEDPPGNRPITTLFRTAFNFDETDSPGSLLMNIQYQDGVTVFLNGNEIFRGNVQAYSDSQIAADSRRSAHQGAGVVVPVRAEILRPTDNCLAVSLHQYSSYSASPLLSLTIGKMPRYSEGFESLPAVGKSELCRVIAQAGAEIPDAATILEKLQGDDSESVRISAAVAAAMNDIPVTMPDLTEPEAHQKLFEQVVQLNEDAWKIVEASKFTTTQYTDALRMAKAALNLKSRVHPELKAGVAGVENTLGVAFYRCAQYEKAVEKLKESLEIVGENPADVAFLSLAYHQLGQEEASQKSRIQFDELVKKEEWLHSRTAFKVQKELASAFGE